LENQKIYYYDSTISGLDSGITIGIDVLDDLLEASNNFVGVGTSKPNVSGIIYIENTEDTKLDESVI
jgi:hypothetical protein